MTKKSDHLRHLAEFSLSRLKMKIEACRDVDDMTCVVTTSVVWSRRGWCHDVGGAHDMV